MTPEMMYAHRLYGDGSGAARYIVSRPSQVDVEAFLNDAREADRAEWLAGSGHGLDEGLRWCVATCRIVFSCCDLKDLPRGPLAIWGVEPPATSDTAYSGLGRGWLALTNEAARRWFPFHRIFTQELALLHCMFPVIDAYADARNVLHLRWLARVGFEHVRVLPLGVNGEPFVHYTHERGQLHV